MRRHHVRGFAPRLVKVADIQIGATGRACLQERIAYLCFNRFRQDSRTRDQRGGSQHTSPSWRRHILPPHVNCDRPLLQLLEYKAGARPDLICIKRFGRPRPLIACAPGFKKCWMVGIRALAPNYFKSKMFRDSAPPDAWILIFEPFIPETGDDGNVGWNS